MSTYSATLAPVANQGRPPIEFLDTLVTWARHADEEIFAPNANPADIYASVKGPLGSVAHAPDSSIAYVWTSPLHRRAAMCEVARVHAGFESSWNWNEGVDITNHHSLANIEGQEAGIFQVSHDSLNLGHGELKNWLNGHLQTAVASAAEFIAATKSYHQFAIEYYARLLRISVAWAGPIAKHKIHPYLSRAAVAEFMTLLS